MDTDVPALELFARQLLALEADPAFQRLRASQERTNLFRIVGKTDSERWHSAFWAWALDPAGSHGLGDHGLRRLLVEAAGPNGIIPSAQLRPKEVQGSPDVAWEPAEGPERLHVRDILTFEFVRAVVAPGPLTEYSEVTARNVLAPVASGGVTRRSSGDTNRFDILLIVQGAQPTSEKPRLLTLVIVVEMKVGDDYDSEQLQRYSRWLHKDPSSRHFPAPVNRDADDALHDFRDRLREIYGQAADAKSGAVHGVGIFLAKSVDDLKSPSPDAIGWGRVSFGSLVGSVLEPALRDPALDPVSRPLIQSYIDLVADEQMEILDMPHEEHRELVRQLRERHKATFRIIAKVLSDDTASDEEAKEEGGALTDEESSAIRRRRASDKPVSLRWWDRSEDAAVSDWKAILVEGMGRLLDLGLTADDLDLWTASAPDDENMAQKGPYEVRPGIWIQTKLSAGDICKYLDRAVRRLVGRQTAILGGKIVLAVTTSSGAIHSFPRPTPGPASEAG
jgi:hypothetical protein